VDATAWIGPTAVVEEGAEIGPRVFVGPGCVIGAGCRIGEDSRLVARVTLSERTQVGKRVLIHPGAVIGREGFGFAKDGERWVRIPQLGRVRLGDDVEIGANTTVDRGALEDTVIADGAKLDNLIQIGHNCLIGENTAMAACSGISGSTRIGRNCTIAGAVGMAGHLEIGDNVHFTGMAMVTRSFQQPGLYSSGIPAMPNADWRRNAARFRHLDDLAKRLKRIEDALADKTNNPEREQD
jgi:UDP-3-O-[3-hydroxymyristoyl] glucosamine N-acyltransferase